MAKPIDNNNKNIFASRLEELILEKNMVHENVAQAIGVTRQGVGKWVNGVSVPDVLTVAKLAKFFDVSVDYLAGHSNVRSADIDLKSDCTYMAEKPLPVVLRRIPRWRKKAPDLFNSVCRCADWLEDACNTCRPGEQIGEHQLSELRKSLYLARLDGYIEAIEAFTGIHYNFTRTDDYYGICDDDEKFIYKVPRCLK